MFSPVLVLKYTAILITAVSEIDENTIWTENVIGRQIMIETGNPRIVNVSTSVNKESESDKTETATATTETTPSTSATLSASKPNHALKPTAQVSIAVLQSTQPR